MRKKWKLSDFIFLGSKITADGDSSHKNKRHLLLGRKAMTNLDNILKSRDIPFPIKGLIVKDVYFSVFIFMFTSMIHSSMIPWKESYDNPRQCIKMQRHHFVDKGPYSPSYGFSNSHV